VNFQNRKKAGKNFKARNDRTGNKLTGKILPVIIFM